MDLVQQCIRVIDELVVHGNKLKLTMLRTSTAWCILSQGSMHRLFLTVSVACDACYMSFWGSNLSVVKRTTDRKL